MAQRKSACRILLGATLIMTQVALPSARAQTTPPAVPAIAGVTPAPVALPQIGKPVQVDGQGLDLQSTLTAEAKLRQAESPPQPDESLFFTPWQHALLQEAKRGFLTRPPGSAQTAAAEANKPSIREISLDGIVYRGPNDWTIYLNKQRVAPDALPDQVMDLKVHADHIDLKWFDTANSLIFPIRLREHQRFNLDARMFLPGTGLEAASAKP